MSNTGRCRLVLVPFVALLAASGITGAAASPPMSASGTFTYGCPTTAFNIIRLADRNVTFDLTCPVSYTGTFNGTSTVHGTLIVHADGSANFRDVETFIGTVNDVPGTLTFNLDGTGRAGSPPTFLGNDVIISGTGGLANCLGVLNEVGTVPAPLPGPLGTYTGQIHCGNP